MLSISVVEDIYYRLSSEQIACYLIRLIYTISSTIMHSYGQCLTSYILLLHSHKKSTGNVIFITSIVTWYHRISKGPPSGLDIIILCHSNIIITMSCHKHVIDQSWALFAKYCVVTSPVFLGLQPSNRLWRHSAIFAIKYSWLVNNLHLWIHSRLCVLYMYVTLHAFRFIFTR